MGALSRRTFIAGAVVAAASLAACDADVPADDSDDTTDVVVTDPPRAGMHPDVVATILRTAPSRVVYVSCNSATQARDLALMDSAYRVAAVQPVDMFPHTHHVENIVLLQRRN